MTNGSAQPFAEASDDRLRDTGLSLEARSGQTEVYPEHHVHLVDMRDPPDPILSSTVRPNNLPNEVRAPQQSHHSESAYDLPIWLSNNVNPMDSVYETGANDCADHGAGGDQPMSHTDWQMFMRILSGQA